MDINFAKTPEPEFDPVGQAEAAISAQLTAVKSDTLGLGGSIYDKIVQTLLYATVVLLPLFYLPLTSSMLEMNKQMLLIVAASAGLIVWLLGAVISGKVTVRTSPIDGGVLAVLVATVVAVIFSMAKAKSVFGLSVSLSSSLASVLALTVLYFLAVNTLHDRGRMLRASLSCSVLLALAIGICQMLGWYILPGVFTHSRAFNTVGSLNTLGLLAAVTLPLFAKASYRGKGRITLALSVIGILLSLVTLSILNWWVLWVITLAGMLAIIAFDSLNATRLAEDYGSHRSRFALSRFLVPVIVIVLGGFLLLVGFNLSSVKGNFPTEVAPSYVLSAQVVKGVLKSNLFSGWGPENFSVAFDTFGAASLANSQLADIRFFDANAELFTIVVHGGALGLLAILFLLWCLAHVVLRFGKAISESVTRGERALFVVEAAGTFSALVALTVALLVYPFNLTAWFVWYVILALSGLSVVGDTSRTVDIEERPAYSLAASMGFIVALILVLAGLYFSSVRYLADVRYQQALAEKTPTDALNGVVRAIDLDSQNDLYYRDASQLTLAVLREEINKPNSADPDRTQRIQNFISSSIQIAQQAVQVAPLEQLNWTNLGQVYQSMSGLVDNVERLADDAYHKANDLRPGDPTFDNRIGAMWMARSDYVRSLLRQSGANAARMQEESTSDLRQAEEAFKRAIEKAPTYGAAIYNLGAVYDRQGRVTDAIRQLEKIVPYNPNEPTLMFELGLLYIRAEQKDRALAAMRRSVLLSPQFANARWYLGLLLEDSGDIQGAIDQLQEIQKNNSKNQVLIDKLQQLESGRRVIPPKNVIDSRPL